MHNTRVVEREGGWIRRGCASGVRVVEVPDASLTFVRQSFRQAEVMTIRHESLNASVRAAMVTELELDQTNGKWLTSPRLTEAGARAWPEILREAFEQHDDAWIAATLRSRDFMHTTEERRQPKGKFITAPVPHTAPDTLAEGEFNRFYARGLCVAVISEVGAQAEVEVYRGKEIENPRSTSEQMIGRRISAQSLLDDLRTAQGVEPALGLPPGPNSGLSVRRVT